MNGRTFVQSLPPCNVPEDPQEQAKQIAQREEALLDAIKAQHGRVALCQVISKVGSHELTIPVSADALMIGEEDPVRFNVSATLLQRIADYYGMRLLTSKVSDLIAEQAAVTIGPCLQTPDALMASTARMLEHHDAIEAKREGKSGMISTVGKDWILSNRLLAHPLGKELAAINYGWHDTHASNHKLWQTNGARHDRFHVDYSQTARLMLNQAMLDGARVNLDDLLGDPKLASLVSDEGPIPLHRLPGVSLDSSDDATGSPPSVPPSA